MNKHLLDTRDVPGLWCVSEDFCQGRGVKVKVKEQRASSQDGLFCFNSGNEIEGMKGSIQ